MIKFILEWFRWKFKKIPNELKIENQNLPKESIFIKERRITHCQARGCKEKLTLLNYHCRYCDKKFCEKHRLPEEHRCPNPKLPIEMRKKSSLVYYRS